jgi:hypothetical protein
MDDQFSALEMLLGDAEELDDPVKRKATAAALRRQNAMGVVGQLMGVQPTQMAGSSMIEGSQTSLRQAMAKQQAAREAASRKLEREQAQANWQAQMERDQARDAEQRRQFGVQEARLGASQNQEARKQWASAVDPITGQMRLYNQITGEWRDEPGMGGTPAQPGQQPQFNPQRGMKPTEKMKNDLVAIQQQRGSVEGALGSAQSNPNAFGFKEGALERFGGDVGTAFAQWKRNPADTATRAFVLNNVSAIINERAGAAQSAQELARLRGFLPSETDDVAHVEAKFNAFLDYLDEREAATRGYSTEELGMTPRTGGGPRKPEYQAPGTAPQAASGRNFEAEYGLGGK